MKMDCIIIQNNSILFSPTNSNLYEEALRGFQAMLNLDFGTDWGNAAAYSFKNKNFILGLIQEFNGMAEAAVDLGLAYFGAAFLGAAETGLETYPSILGS